MISTETMGLLLSAALSFPLPRFRSKLDVTNHRKLPEGGVLVAILVAISPLTAR